MGIRFAILIFCFSSLFIGLISNIYHLQITKGDYYSAQMASVFSSSGALDSLRGNIYFTDKNGERINVTMKKEYPTVFADNRLVADQKETVGMLGEIIKDVPEEKLTGIFSKAGARGASGTRKALQSCGCKASSRTHHNAP